MSAFLPTTLAAAATITEHQPIAAKKGETMEPQCESPSSRREIQTLTNLVDEIEAVLDQRSDDTLRDDMVRVMSSFKPDLEELSAFAHFDQGKKYTRNLIATDNQRYTLMLLCWNKGKASPIHDHPCDGCWLQVIQGSVFEKRYEQRAGKLELTSHVVAKAGDVAYIHDSMGFHSIGVHGDGDAMSLHLYIPPFERCRVWLNPDDADNVMKPLITYHTEYGMRVTY